MASQQIVSKVPFGDLQHFQVLQSLSDPVQRASVLVEVYKRYGAPFKTLNKATGKYEGHEVVGEDGNSYAANLYGTTNAVIAIRRKNFVTKNELIIKAKAIDANLGAYLRHSALLLRISNNFMLYIAQEKGYNSSVVAKFTGVGGIEAGSYTLSYDDFHDLHNYIINQKIRKLTKFVSYSRMRLGGSVSGVNALFYPCYLTNQISKVIGETLMMVQQNVDQGLYRGDLFQGIRALVLDEGGDIVTVNSRNILKEFFVRSVTPDVTSGSYVTFPAGHPFIDLLDVVSPFVGITKNLDPLQQQANDAAINDPFIRSAAKSNKNKKIKDVFSKKKVREVNFAGVTFNQVIGDLKTMVMLEDRQFNTAVINAEGLTKAKLVGYLSEKAKFVDTLVVKMSDGSVRVNSFVVSIICASFTWGKGDTKYAIGDDYLGAYFPQSREDIVSIIDKRVGLYKGEKDELKKANATVDRSLNIDCMREATAIRFVAFYDEVYKGEIKARATARVKRASAAKKAGTGKLTYNPTTTN